MTSHANRVLAELWLQGDELLGECRSVRKLPA